MTAFSSPDGVAPNSLGFLPNPKAAEMLAPPLIGEDLTWVAGVGGAKGMQPISATNPNGNQGSVSPMSPGLKDVLSAPSVG
jgi:hypothetical protein